MSKRQESHDHGLQGDMSPEGHVPSADTTAHQTSVLASGPVGSPCLVVFSGSRPTRSFWLDRPLTIGRTDASDVSLEDASASRVHLRLVPRREIVDVEDLGSRNGTFLDGRPIVRAQAARDNPL